MSKIVVNDAQLGWITCRLCQDELGNSRIVPGVQEQIEYCFGIKVQPSDGLPQLICQTCKEILDNYSKIKNNFISKQDELVKTGHNNLQRSQLERASPSPQYLEESLRNFKSVSSNDKLRKSKRRRPCISSDSEDENTFEKTDRNSHINEKNDETWSEKYIKQFVCRICSTRCSDVATMKNHMINTHGALYKKHGSIFKRHCNVTLRKTDEKPNITGFSNTIMFDSEKIVTNVNANYHIIYTAKDYKGDKHNAPHVEEQINKFGNKIISCFSLDSSDEEMTVQREQRPHLDSRSSMDTVLLDNNSIDTVFLDNNSNMADDNKQSMKLEINKVPAACINLDDSSDNESEKSLRLKTKSQNQLSNNTKNELGTDVENQRILDEVIATSHNKYTKKQEKDANKTKNPSDIASKLQHKIFSIGRKHINKSLVVNCTPLLRLLENKTLDIVWLPREIVGACQTSNFTRIMPRRKTRKEKSDDNDKGWIDYTSTVTNLISLSENNNSEQTHGQLKARKEISTSESQCISDMAVISDANSIGIEIKKLLNANPVANPKQLPKKCASNELIKLAPKPAVNPSQANNNLDPCKIIITSTTSLAGTYLAVCENDDPVKKSKVSTPTDKQQSEAPRIKVKPVSELMSVETLNRIQSSEQSNLQIQTNILPKGQPLIVQNVTAPPMMSTPDKVQLQAATYAGVPVWQNDLMILDTVELPNNISISPFLYFKKLLLMHNITLLGTCVELNNTFHCLIKFKVQYKQDILFQPVVLCLALYCLNSTFCIKIKDRNNEELDITQISANWQWEVLKIYKGEVVSKLLNNAQAISTEVYEYTKTFVCLLKSINVKQPNTSLGIHN